MTNDSAMNVNIIFPAVLDWPRMCAATCTCVVVASDVSALSTLFFFFSPLYPTPSPSVRATSARALRSDLQL